MGGIKEKALKLNDSINRIRFSLMQDYLYVYGDRLDGNSCRLECHAKRMLAQSEEVEFLTCFVKMRQNEKLLKECLDEYDAVLSQMATHQRNLEKVLEQHARIKNEQNCSIMDSIEE